MSRNRGTPRRLSDGEVVGVVDGVERILAMVGPSLVRGDYGLIVGEDTSGRLPALLVARAVRQARRAAGLTPPPMVFLQGAGRAPAERELTGLTTAFAARRHLIDAAQPGSRALIITEFVGAGRSSGEIARRLAELGHGADVATLATNTDESYCRRHGGWPDDMRLFTAEADFEIVVRRPWLSGLRRQKFAAAPVLTGARSRAIATNTRGRLGRELHERGLS